MGDKRELLTGWRQAASDHQQLLIEAPSNQGASTQQRHLRGKWKVLSFKPQGCALILLPRLPLSTYPSAMSAHVPLFFRPTCPSTAAGFRLRTTPRLRAAPCPSCPSCPCPSIPLPLMPLLLFPAPTYLHQHSGKLQIPHHFQPQRCTLTPDPTALPAPFPLLPCPLPHAPVALPLCPVLPPLRSTCLRHTPSALLPLCPTCTSTA